MQSRSRQSGSRQLLPCYVDLKNLPNLVFGLALSVGIKEPGRSAFIGIDPLARILHFFRIFSQRGKDAPQGNFNAKYPPRLICADFLRHGFRGG